MKRRFVISDHHLGHENILTFTNGTGKLTRPFDTLDEMHEVIIECHNKVVRPEDTVYFLGDVVINRKKGFPILPLLNGRKILIKGNHDIFKLKDYLPHFADIRGVHVLPHKAVLSHVPLHPDSVDRPSWNLNIHGHLHQNTLNDPRYFNACVERLNYIPKDIEEIIQ